MMLDPASSPLGQMLLDEITPVVMVLRTPLVEETCQKNGLSFLQMLTPFCAFNNIDVPVRTASDQPYRLKKFKLRLFYASEVRQPDIEVAKERLKQVITDAGDTYFSDMNSGPPPIESILTAAQPDFVPSWFQFFNKELIRSASFSDYEAFDHPVACLLVVSSKDEEPINKFVDLFNTNQLPSLLNDGAMDPKILKLFILVHDNQDGSPERATKMLTDMRNTFGYNECRLLCINSSQSAILDRQENPWASYNPTASPGEHLGSMLSNDDMIELKNVVHDLSSKHIIPYMEQKVRILNQQVSATRKGFRNQIKNLWWRKGKEDTPDISSVNMYTFSSIESQIRLLGDYAFMLRDYELALSNYRLLSTDYKLDKAWKRYAGVQEMMGLTYFMLDQSRKDAEYCMENAFSTYIRIGSLGLRSATRCGLWWVEMLKARDQLKEAASVYFRISGEEPLHSAVMLEQASYCYLLAKPPMLRKYGFHLILSGDLYKKCHQIKHAIRTYQGALSVFRGTTWNHIRDHVHFHVGKWYAFLGLFDVAMKHMLEVIACSHQSKATQELILRDFFQILQKTGKSYEVSRLQLPAINISMLKVVSEDHRTYGSPDAVTVKESLWKSLEEDMIPSFSTAKTNWLDVPKLLANKLKQSNVCVAGEALKVDIGFKNPLQISVSISNVSLICEHSARSDERDPATDATSSTSEQESDVEVGKRELGSYVSLFTLSEEDICLEGGETVVAQLTVTPRVEGMLRIVGVRWKLSGSIVGFYNFEPDLLKKNVPKGRRKAKHPTDKILEFLVIKGLPKLEGFIHHLPKTVYAGDLQRLSLELRNPSEIPVKNVKIKISHPRFLKIGNQEVMDLDFPACLEKKNNSAQDDVQADSYKASETAFLLHEDTVIQGETPFLLPLWLRAATPGNNSLYLALYYEIDDKSTGMRYRTLRMHYNLEVLPSLDVSFSISPCPSRLQEFLVRMDIINRTRSESFKLHQLSSMGNEWEISLLQPIEAIFPSGYLMAGQALSCFLKLKNGSSGITAEGEGMDVRLGHDSSEALFDTHSSPFVDFHHYERLHKKMANQGHQTSVDFILISQMQGSQIIFSHHACHCSISSTSPIWWLMEGPHTIYHNFSAASFCEIELNMVIHNSSDSPTSVHIDTFDSTSTATSANATLASSGNKVGWHDASTPKEIKLTSEISGSGTAKSALQDGISPFIWSGSSSTRVKLEPMSTTEVPLLVCVFCPGTYDLSNYAINWTILPSDDHGVSASSGTGVGHSFYLTVLQQD